MAKIDDIHKRANEIYAFRKLGADVGYRAPEAMPRLQSDQIMALMEVLVDEIEQLEARIAYLEKDVDDDR